MRAAIFDPSIVPQGLRLGVVPIPDHSSGQALLEVKAAALNPSNYKIIPARVPFVRHLRQWVVGYDVAGIVRSVGGDPSCSHFKVGDEVYGVSMLGSIAEYTAVSCSTIAHKSKVLNFTEAAALPVASLTSLEAIEKGQIKKGDSMLVIGASGGCGIFAIKLAKARGITTTGICSTRNIAFVKSLQADFVVDYKDKKQMKALTQEGPRFDMVYDTVTSFDPLDPDYLPFAQPLLKKDGKYIAINGKESDWTVAVIDRLTRIIGFTIQRSGYELFMLEPKAESMQKLSGMFDNGEIEGVPLDSLYRMDGDNASFVNALWGAMAKMKSRRTVGKIVFEF